jgi:hypothetical protein
VFVAVYDSIVGMDATTLAGRPPDGLADFARRHDGCFSVFRYDKASRTIDLFGDHIGQLHLRYAVRGTDIAVSTHDIGLVAAGIVEPVADPVSLASAGGIGWSVGSASIISGITVCRSDELTTLSADGVRTLPLGVPEASAPISHALPWLEAGIGRDDILIELSAGFDSRASLAATLAVAEPSRITAFSEGPADSLDVVVAEEVARRAGVRFVHRQTIAPPTDAMVAAWERLATENNGNFDVSILASMRTDQPSGVIVCGDGGEIHRGYFYPFLRFAPWTASDVLRRKYRGHPAAVLDRVEKVAMRLRHRSTTERETLDRFYATERFGVWNQKLARSGGRRISPFYSRLAASASYGGDHSLHYELIARYLPQTLDLPVNGGAAVRRYGPGAINAAAVTARSLVAKVQRRLKRQQPDLHNARLDALGDFSQAVADRPGMLFQPPTQTGGRYWQELGALRMLAMCRELMPSPVSAPSC